MAMQISKKRNAKVPADMTSAVALCLSLVQACPSVTLSARSTSCCPGHRKTSRTCQEVNSQEQVRAVVKQLHDLMAPLGGHS